MSQWLIFLAIVPVSCFYLTKNMKTKKRYMWNGIAFGMVIAPVSFGLIQMTYIPLVGKLLGLVGVVGNLTHGSIGYLCLLGSGVLEMNTVITASQLVMINAVNGVLFAYIYGLIGYAVDRKLATESISAVRIPVHTAISK
jgi:hypothetical protein